MIFITVGTSNKGYDRLIQKCDTIARNLKIDFFAQTGSSTYKPTNIQFKDWLSEDEMQSKYKFADAFIVHGGFGTLSEVLSFHKPIIVIPRSSEDGEAVNDQKDLSFKLDRLGYVKCLIDLNQLEDVIANLKSIKLNRYELISDIPDIVSQEITLFKKGKRK